ncbi:hypothetical protein FQR65_LT17939 [Abscondita terminalis]|nr:hypothetical protein FQR65_LT17939 [Abscondita terminalis]
MDFFRRGLMSPLAERVGGEQRLAWLSGARVSWKNPSALGPGILARRPMMPVARFFPENSESTASIIYLGPRRRAKPDRPAFCQQLASKPNGTRIIFPMWKSPCRNRSDRRDAGAVQILREQRPELVIGVGTVLDRAMLGAAEAAGAQFIVTPGVTRDLLQASVDSPIPLLPGISNASGIMEGYALGYRRFKLFPAEVSGGGAAAKDLGGPFGEIKFCPTGGVGPAQLSKAYMALRNVMCVGGQLDA